MYLRKYIEIKKKSHLFYFKINFVLLTLKKLKNKRIINMYYCIFNFNTLNN